METLVPVVLGAAITFLIELGKKFGIGAKLMLAGFAILMAVGYTLFTEFVNPDMQKHIIEFTATAMATSVAIYEYILKFFKEKQGK